MLRDPIQSLLLHAPVARDEEVGELAVQHKIRIAAYRTREVRVEILRKAEVAHVAGVVARPLHRTQHHHRYGAFERFALDAPEKCRHVPPVRKVAAFHAYGREIRAQLLKAFRIGTLMQTGQYLDSPRPKLLGHRLVGRNHAFLHHLVGFIVGSRHKPGHAAFAIQQYLGFRDFKIQRTFREAPPAQLLGKRTYRQDRLCSLRRAAPLADDVKHLLVGEPVLGTDHGLREPPGDASPRLVEGHEDGEREPVLSRHKRAYAVRQLLRKHRHHPVEQIHARGAPVRLAVNGCARLHVMRHIGDVHAKHHVALAVALQRQRIVEILCRRGVAGEYVFPAEVKPLVEEHGPRRSDPP